MNTVAPQAHGDILEPTKLPLDSGSTGMRIYKKPLSLMLQPIVDDKGGKISACQVYGGGSSMWGTLATADVKLGGETARAVPIQIVDDGLTPRAPDCPKSAKTVADDGANGLLGINVAKYDGAGSSYFVCTDSACTAFPISNLIRVQNPVALLPADNNGVTITFPQVTNDNAPVAEGNLFLGVGIRPNNQPPRSSSICRTGADGYFRSSFQGADFWAMVDSGTNAFDMPSAITFAPKCSGSSYLCPQWPLDITFELANRDSSSCGTVRR